MKKILILILLFTNTFSLRAVTITTATNSVPPEPTLWHNNPAHIFAFNTVDGSTLPTGSASYLIELDLQILSFGNITMIDNDMDGEETWTINGDLDWDILSIASNDNEVFADVTTYTGAVAPTWDISTPSSVINIHIERTLTEAQALQVHNSTITINNLLFATDENDGDNALASYTSTGTVSISNIIPEPSSTLLILLGSLFLFRRKRR